MIDRNLIGVDLGGTKVLVGKVRGQEIVSRTRFNVPSADSMEEVLGVIIKAIEREFDNSTIGIGLGVPSVVDVEKGIVYDVQNIASWKEVYLKKALIERFNCQVKINNDANCFALGERHFGLGKSVDNYVALIVGTGVAAGLIINGRLYNGAHCGAGEIGMIPYLDQHLEYYGSGQYFSHVHGTTGKELAEAAENNDKKALAMFKQFGEHFGHVINTVLYTYDPEMIVLGGSVSRAYRFFEHSMKKVVKSNAYTTVKEGLRIEISSSADMAVLGAAALCLEPMTTGGPLNVNVNNLN